MGVIPKAFGNTNLIAQIKTFFKKFQNFQVGSAGDDFKVWMTKSTNPNLLKISEKFSSYHYDFDAAFKKMSGGEFSMLEGEQFLQASIRIHFTNR